MQVPWTVGGQSCSGVMECDTSTIDIALGAFAVMSQQKLEYIPII